MWTAVLLRVCEEGDDCAVSVRRGIYALAK